MSVFNKRTVVKTLSWRVISIGVTAAVFLLLTGSLATAGIVGLVYEAIKTLLFYTHEHLWSKSDYGRGTRLSGAVPSYGSEDD